MISLAERELFKLVLTDNIDEFKEKFGSNSTVNKFCVNNDGLSLLDYAVQCESVNALEFLCQDPDLRAFKGQKGTPAVHYVVDHMNEDVIEVLKRHDFDFNELDRFGKNVLHAAARVCEHEDFVKLIRLGADIKQRSSRGETPKDTLTRWGNTKVKLRESSEELNH